MENIDGINNPKIQTEKVFIIHSETKPDKTNFKRKVCMVGAIDGTKLKVGVSQCTKADMYKYTKKLARTIAEGRLGKKPSIEVDIYREGEPNNLASPKEIVRIMHSLVEEIKVK